MRYLAIMGLALGTVLVGGAAYADNDDLRWVAKCVQDNASATVEADVVAKYCACMNNKMDENETLTITQWQATHPTELATCKGKVGWAPTVAPAPAAPPAQ